jgi:PemK-like, MazF-like toxin of type II toxin-antitoxin system
MNTPQSRKRVLAVWSDGVPSLRRLVESVTRTVRPSTKRAKPVPSGRTIVVTYEPRLDGDADPGEVVWGWVPYEDDPRQGKDRPMVVIGTRNRKLVAVPLTSKRDDRDPQVSVGTGGWDRDHRESYARIDRVLEIAPRDVRREGAILERERFVAVVEAVRERHPVTVR